MFEIVTAVRPVPASSLATSVTIHAAVIATLFAVGISGSVAKLPSRHLHFTLLAPPPDLAPLPARKPEVLPPSHNTARAFVKLPAPPTAPKPILDLPPAPAIETPALAAPVAELSRVAPPPVTVGTFSATLPAAPAPAAQATLKTVAFSSTEASALKLSHSGAVAASGGFDAVSAQQTGSRHGSATRAAGFGEANASSGASAGTSAGKPAASKGGFGDASVSAPETAHRGSALATSATSGIEILEKPRPAYTEEARRLSLEGEVLLEVSFCASGEAHVIRLVHGLGHGLDESAAAAARLIRFRPARREGVPVDSTAVVHIVFQLAY